MSIARAKSQHQRRVEAFMHGARQSIPEKPTVPDLKTRILRARLLLEETLETINEGLGLDVKCGGTPVSEDDITFVESHRGPDIVQIADGGGDISVVNTGMLSACGIADQLLLEEIDNNNLTKLETGTLRADGKLIKSPHHQPPNIEMVLRVQGWTR